MPKRKVVRFANQPRPSEAPALPPTKVLRGPRYYMDAIDRALNQAHVAGFLSVANFNRVTTILANEFEQHIKD